MHRKFSKKGVACVSVSLDPADRQPAALAFLKKQGAAFANYWLDEEADVWQDRFEVNGPPAVFVFNKEGKRVRKFDTSDPDGPYTYKDVEKVVEELIDQVKSKK
jgi:hypothetical protein